MKRFVVGCVVVAASYTATFTTIVPVAAQVPSVTSLSPPAVGPGQTSALILSGDNLNEATGLWTNLPGATAEVVPLPPGKDGKPPAPNPKRADIKLTLPADAVPGIYGLRVLTSHGASNLRLFVVDDLPSVAEKGDNKSREKAQVLTPPVAVDGASESESYDYYRFHAEAGSRLSVEAVARRMGSSLDPVVRLLDAAGHELAYADDDESTGPDGRFTYRFQKTGDYWVEIRDIRYAGNANYRYRLRIGDFPLLSAPYPMGVRQGTASLVQAIGADVGPIAPLTITAGPAVDGRRPLSARYAEGQGSGLSTLAVSAAPEQTEVEPNDKPESAAPLALVGAINGRFERAKDRDYYRIEAKKGDRFRFIGRTRGFGTPTDLLLRMTAADGKTLVEAEDSGLDEGVLDYTFAADGVYLLAVEDLLGRGGPQYAYRVEIEPYSPGFSLAVDAEKFDIPLGGVARPKITAVRRDYTGPITLKLAFEGEAGDIASADITATGIIPEGKPDGLMTIQAGPGLPAGKLLLARIVGEAEINKKTVQATAGTALAMKTLLGGLTIPPAGLGDRVAFSIGPPMAAFFQLEAPSKIVALPQLIGKGKLTVKLKRLEKFDDVVDLKVEGLPAGYTAAAAKIEKGKTEAVIEISGPPTAAPIAQPIQVVGSGTYLFQPRSETLADLMLKVVMPVEAVVDVPATLAPGGKQKLAVKLVRHFDDKTPITLRWSTLPRGVTATAAEVQVPADKLAAETELTVDPQAPLGPSTAVLTATATIGGRMVAFDVAGVSLNVSNAKPVAAAKPTETAKPADSKPAAKPAATAPAAAAKPEPKPAAKTAAK